MLDKAPLICYWERDKDERGDGEEENGRGDLDYFNEYLFEHGIIDEVMRNKLKIKISTTEKRL